MLYRNQPITLKITDPHLVDILSGVWKDVATVGIQILVAGHRCCRLSAHRLQLGRFVVNVTSCARNLCCSTLLLQLVSGIVIHYVRQHAGERKGRARGGGGVERDTQRGRETHREVERDTQRGRERDTQRGRDTQR